LIACHHDDHDLGVIADLRRREARFRALLDRPTHGVHVHIVTGDVDGGAYRNDFNGLPWKTQCRVTVWLRLCLRRLPARARARPP
jgi:hypothetical protein